MALYTFNGPRSEVCLTSLIKTLIDKIWLITCLIIFVYPITGELNGVNILLTQDCWGGGKGGDWETGEGVDWVS